MALGTWRKLDWNRRGLLIEAMLTLPIAAVLLSLIPFRHVARWLGTVGRESPPGLSVTEARRGADIGWAVRAVARRLPGRPRCLSQGLAATLMAQRRRIPATIYLGVARGKDNRMEAHAWVRCGERIVTGRAGHQRFQVVERFSRD